MTTTMTTIMIMTMTTTMMMTWVQSYSSLCSLQLTAQNLLLLLECWVKKMELNRKILFCKMLHKDGA